MLNTQLLKIWNGAERFCLVAMLYMDHGIPVNAATFPDEETWFELIGTAGWTFSFMHAADGFAEAAGTELCEGKRLVDEADVEEIAGVEVDWAGTYPLAMWDNSRLSLTVISS